VQLLKENGSGDEYSPPGPSDPYFQLPLVYWLDDDYLRLKTPGKAILLIGLGEQEEFELPVARVRSWYGISQETALRGFEELVRAGLIMYDQRPVKDAMHPAGVRIAKLWRLTGAYAWKERRQTEEVRVRRVK
jgi:hypothetical protein